MPTDLRIYLLTGEDPLFTADLVEPLLNRYGSQVKGAAFISGLATKKRFVVSPFAYGFFRFGFLACRIILDSILGGKVGKSLGRHGVPIDHFDSVRDGKLLARLRELEVTMLISINCNKRLRGEVITHPKYGVLNIHNGLLPKYRGLMPILHAIANDEPHVGITVHFIDETIDTGPIIEQSMVAILPTDNLVTLWKRATVAGVPLLLKAVEDAANGKVIGKPNGPEGASYYSYPNWRQLGKYQRRFWAARLRRTLQLFGI